MTKENTGITSGEPPPFTDLGKAVRRPVKWVVRGLLTTGMGLLGGPPKESKKSTITMAAALAVGGYGQHGLPKYMLSVPEEGNVLVLSDESDADELKEMVEAGFGTDLEAHGTVWIADNPGQFRLDSEDGQVELMHWLEEMKCRLLIVDPLRNFHSLDENDAGVINNLVRPLRTWAHKNDSCVLFVHHTAKKNTREHGDFNNQDFRGSGALMGMTDTSLVVTPRQDGRITINATFKRAASWNKTLTLGIWGEVAEELEGDIERKIRELALAGAGGLGICQQLRISRSRLLEALRWLVSVGKINPSTAEKVTQHGPTKEEASARGSKGLPRGSKGVKGSNKVRSGT